MGNHALEAHEAAVRLAVQRFGEGVLVAGADKFQRHGLDAIQEAIKSFGDGALELFVEIFADCIPWKNRVQLSRNPF